MEFSVKVDQETFYWKVKAAEMSRLQIKFFWVHFASIPDESPTEDEVSMMLAEDSAGGQIRVNEADFVRLLLRSDIF
ncbi:hypothetical protein BDV98DRAFT_95233 [Pterulicium gracile]|uniref:Uncharacterized protein n=1 Tax=Pterulicium gracile TaxID=1884261 RepID=A0A5C3QJY3_9AGAR|nr:hypothetical protein BDV98DRAFT_95233 [Pterula gracilis]